MCFHAEYLNAQVPSEARLLRFPAVHDNRIVFSYAGDLYQVSKSGGVARKLTSDVGFEMFPRFSPDGSDIAFTGQFEGNTEVFVIPSNGGIPLRLTYTATLGRDDISDRMGPNNIVMTWKDNNHIIYRSRKQSFNDFQGQLYSVNIKGGLSQELPFSLAGWCSYSPDGKQLAMNRVFREFRTWKYYRGGMADDIWIFDLSSKQWQNITNNDAQDIEPMWSGNKIYYLSDRDRTMNLFVFDVTNKQTRKVTNYTDFDIKFPSLGDKNIVFEKGGYLYNLNLDNEEINQVHIQMDNDYEQWSHPEMIDASKFIEGWDLAPDAKRLSFVARGDVFTVPAESGITRNLTQSNSSHDRDAVWSPDRKWIAYTSDASGEDEIYLRHQDGSGDEVRITTNGDNYKYHLTWSPDSKKILWSDRKQTLQYVTVDSKQITQVDHSGIGEFNNYDWSPDSKWICYVHPEWQTQNRIFLYNLVTKVSTPVTDNWYNSYEPSFTKDGKYLMLISDREFNPTFSNTEFQISYQNMSKVYLITLLKETPSPFAPENDEVENQEPATIERSDVSPNKNASKPKTDKSKTAKSEHTSVSHDIKVDLDGIMNRIISLPIEPAQYNNIQNSGDNIYYLRSKAGEDGTTLLVFKIKDKKEETLGPIDNFQISADGKKMAIEKSRNYSVIDLPQSKITTDKNVDLSNLKIWANHHSEYAEIFNESWRQMRDFFYNPTMNGVDWNSMKIKYGALIPYVNHRADLTYVIGEMIAELSIGHAYVGGGDKPEVKKIPMGLLGAKLMKDSVSGYFKIIKILQGGNWSSDLRSPLTEVGVNAKPGDYIIAVNGAPANQMNDIYVSLINQANKQVEITLNSKPVIQGSRKVIVTPVADEKNLYYFNWVEHNIHYVDSVSHGKVGYLHIPNMGVEGLNEFMRHYYPQLNKKALIVDDRGNGGGFVSSLVAQRLALSLVYFNMARNQMGGTDPQMILGPKALLVNEYSASDGDIIAYRFKALKIGPVIGKRTWGGVTGIRGTLPIVDGGFLNRPEFGPYDSTGFLIEGHGVDPDISVDQDPALEYLGIDQQLDKGIQVVMDMLKSHEQTVPDIPKFPDKSK
ncbi:MAG: PD40 domain-containing protein [Chitinophagales bacterium]|nr:PD40 domain-containing protein [Chitinophagales bacterium]